jgi:predicted nucleotidyltransferase component of viral defense system
MDSFLKMSPKDRRLTCLQVEERMHLQAASVEKDFWICWTLRELFALPEIGPHLTFKGGTSLSKAWKLIERFSEDIDLIVDKQTLGFAGDASPDRAPSKKQRKLRLEALMEACRRWVQETLQPALADRIRAALGPTGWKLEVDPDMADGQCLLFHYPGDFDPAEAGYVRPVVKIELGARSDDWPHQEKLIQPYLAEAFPNLASGAAIPVRVLAAERTFWEKALLLHEETFRPADKPRKFRMARHYYDVWCLITRGVAERAAQDRPLFDRVAAHREIFFRWSWVDYTTLHPGSLRFLPPAHHVDAWRKDYQEMRGEMFFGEVPTFDEILGVVGAFEKQFNQHAKSS